MICIFFLPEENSHIVYSHYFYKVNRTEMPDAAIYKTEIHKNTDGLLVPAPGRTVRDSKKFRYAEARSNEKINL